MPRRTPPDVRHQPAGSTPNPRATARQIEAQTVELAALAKRAGLRHLAYFLEVTSLQAAEDGRRAPAP